ncbi:TldD/PmbA family protein [Candidatus Fermentibacteria bacterium]|nr:MAG: TldD/PmbA family protein [Candidatus Fermentibacteria bacterium]
MERNILRKYANLFSGYTELRLQENRTSRISVVDGTVMGNSSSSESGVSARSYKGGSWGFASSPETDSEAIEHVIEAATENAVFLDSHLEKAMRQLPVSSAEGTWDYSTKRSVVSRKDKIDFAREVDSYISQKFRKLSTRTVVIHNLDMEKQLITSTGSNAYSMVPRSIMYAMLTVDTQDGPVQLYEAIGGLGQFEDVFARPSDYYSRIDSLYEHLLRKAEGVFPEPGISQCILDADIAGILAHEAIGHTTEADIVRGGSVAADYMDQTVASPLVTLVDFAHTAMGKTCPVPVHIDDEGTPAEDVTIIRDGVLKSYMHNRESAMEFGVTPTGNARGYSFSDEPIIRMRNTAFLPGTSSLEEMIQSVDNGYYLIKSSNGQADSTSEFMFGVTLGYEIKNGKLGRALKDTTISGVAFDMLKTVTAVSGEMSWNNAGMCGKKQMIPVGMGGPAIKCMINIGGR